MKTSDTILIMNGPNLNLLGTREPDMYGESTLEKINQRIQCEAGKSGVHVDFFQSNHEGDLIERLHGAIGKVRGVVINAGAYAHTSLALADAVSGTNLRTIEVHMTNISRREEIRKTSLLSPVCEGVIHGFGWKVYLLAVHALLLNDQP